MWLVRFLPFRAVAAIGEAMGSVVFWLIPERRKVTRVNLAKCFPHWSEEKRETIARAHFRAFLRSFIDRGILWWSAPERVEAMDQEVVVAEAGEGVPAQEAGDGAGGDAGVEEDDAVAGADEIARHRDRHALGGALTVEEARLLEADEAVLKRVEPLDRHSLYRLALALARGRRAAGRSGSSAGS